MAEVKIMVGGRQYTVHCRDGEEARLHELASMMSEKVTQVKTGNPSLTEVRQLLFAGLLLADSLSEKTAELHKRNLATPPQLPLAEPASPPPPPAPAEDDPALIAVLERLALRIESLGDNLATDVVTA
jgi:cell division protein ZapA